MCVCVCVSVCVSLQGCKGSLNCKHHEPHDEGSSIKSMLYKLLVNLRSGVFMLQIDGFWVENPNLVKPEILQHLQSRFKLIEVMYKHCSLFKAEILQHLQSVGGKRVGVEI